MDIVRIIEKSTDFNNDMKDAPCRTPQLAGRAYAAAEVQLDQASQVYSCSDRH